MSAATCSEAAPAPPAQDLDQMIKALLDLTSSAQDAIDIFKQLSDLAHGKHGPQSQASVHAIDHFSDKLHSDIQPRALDPCSSPPTESQSQLSTESVASPGGLRTTLPSHHRLLQAVLPSDKPAEQRPESLPSHHASHHASTPVQEVTDGQSVKSAFQRDDHEPPASRFPWAGAQPTRPFTPGSSQQYPTPVTQYAGPLQLTTTYHNGGQIKQTSFHNNGSQTISFSTQPGQPFDIMSQLQQEGFNFTYQPPYMGATSPLGPVTHGLPAFSLVPQQQPILSGTQAWSPRASLYIPRPQPQGRPHLSLLEKDGLALRRPFTRAACDRTLDAVFDRVKQRVLRLIPDSLLLVCPKDPQQETKLQHMVAKYSHKAAAKFMLVQTDFRPEANSVLGFRGTLREYYMCNVNENAIEINLERALTEFAELTRGAWPELNVGTKRNVPVARSRTTSGSGSAWVHDRYVPR